MRVHFHPPAPPGGVLKNCVRLWVVLLEFLRMKVTFLSLAISILFIASGHAVDVVTPDEKYFDVKVTKVEAEGVRITHREGTAFVDFDFLPPAMQLQNGWTPEKSAARKAARDAETKRIADEERMKEEEPKRLAAEAAAKERAVMEKANAESAARAKVDAVEAQKDLMAEAAQARAQIDRDRARARSGTQPVAVPDAEPIAEAKEKAEVTESPVERAKPAMLPAGSVAALFEEQQSQGPNRNILIGLGIASGVVVLLFLLASGRNKVRVVTPGARKRR